MARGKYKKCYELTKRNFAKISKFKPFCRISWRCICGWACWGRCCFHDQRINQRISLAKFTVTRDRSGWKYRACIGFAIIITQLCRPPHLVALNSCLQQRPLILRQRVIWSLCERNCIAPHLRLWMLLHRPLFRSFLEEGNFFQRWQNFCAWYLIFLVKS